MEHKELKEAICEVGRRLYMKDLTVATDGNISIRLSPDRYLCTPSGVSKYDMRPGDILLADEKGNKIEGEGKVTSEFFTHLAAYEERDDISAVVHAHPPKAIALMLSGHTMEECVLPEVVYTLGGIPTTPYATPGTKEGSVVLREFIRQTDAVLLDRHGAVTVGKDVFAALRMMEKIEHAAETLVTAHLLGSVRRLKDEEIDKLLEVRVAYGFTGPTFLKR
ncbi:MAG: class II aldolase/adducin family protein [Candidatus Sumerlaeia bacterium]